ncbi:MAG: nicotinate-nucleotide--dimethylbenzimidazole phosphoribosyltransferase [Actinomycetota bacterium]|nr:nicotinate-nucleotide--dimethylbenzimidazole phosphoribosyltransferase [Actinomycetota bacterium]
MNLNHKENEKKLYSLLMENLSRVGILDARALNEAQKKLDNLTKPKGSLGRLEELAMQIAGISGRMVSRFDNKTIFTMAGDHGVTEEKVSTYPKEVTPQMVFNFLSGKAAINVLAKHIGAEVMVVDMGVSFDFEDHPFLINKKVGYGTRNMAREPAMTREEAMQSILNGIETCKLATVKKTEPDIGTDIIGTGDMGIGNTTASSAIAAVICDADVADVTGLGTGLNEEGLHNKINVIRKAIKINKPDKEDAIDILAKVGGFEIGGIAGLIIGAAINRIPVVIDGFISGAGALIALKLCPDTKHFMIASHQSVEKGHIAILSKLGLKPLFNLDLRLGEGTGAALGINFAEASLKIMNEMATFSEAKVSGKSE